MLTPAVYWGPATAALAALAVGTGLIAFRRRIVAVYARVADSLPEGSALRSMEWIARIGVPALGALWLVIGLFGLAVSLLEL